MDFSSRLRIILCTCFCNQVRFSSKQSGAERRFWPLNKMPSSANDNARKREQHGLLLLEKIPVRLRLDPHWMKWSTCNEWDFFLSALDLGISRLIARWRRFAVEGIFFHLSRSESSVYYAYEYIHKWIPIAVYLSLSLPQSGKWMNY